MFCSNCIELSILYCNCLISLLKSNPHYRSDLATVLHNTVLRITVQVDVVTSAQLYLRVEPWHDPT